jgi:hypothetical protein
MYQELMHFADSILMLQKLLQAYSSKTGTTIDMRIKNRLLETTLL